jgi:hypothetical protein
MIRKDKLRKSTPEDDERFAKRLEEGHVGFREGLVMTLSAILTILPVVAIVLGALVVLTLLIFRLL